MDETSRHDDTPGVAGIEVIRASWVGTAVMALSAIPAVVDPKNLAGPYVVVSAVLFVVGSVVFLVGFFRAVSRSRTELISVFEVYFLTGSVPSGVRLNLMGSFAVQVAIALGAGVARMYTATAFGMLAPVFGLGIAGLWSSRYATFTPRELPTG